METNYSLYLVTDSTPATLGDKNIVAVVRAALEGGATIVQYRDKMSETADLIRIAKELHEVTQEYQVPLLINDRVDVALAVGAEGVHLGQEDMDLAAARRILGQDAIIGITSSNVGEAKAAVIGGATYLGIGTMFATQTKPNTKSIIGTAGTKAILHSLSAMDRKISTVAIGGINSSNVQRVMFQSKSSFKGLDGVAVVSAIMAAKDPKAAAAHLRSLIGVPPRSVVKHATKNRSVEQLLVLAARVIKRLVEVRPLCHNMTNFVVQNFAANVAIAIGARPIMSNNGAEAADLAKLDGALVINMGTVTADGLSNYLQALRAYNLQGGPVLFDPVGAGATQARRAAVSTLMAGGYFDVIKGNESEINVLAEGTSGTQQKGVDSGDSSTSPLEKARLVKRLAARERTVIIMTGITDYLSDGERTLAVHNGHAYLDRITGSGCTLGTTIAACVAVEKGDKLLGALAGMLMFEIAASRAGNRADVQGPGTFVPKFLDELSRIHNEAQADYHEWVTGGNVEMMEV